MDSYSNAGGYWLARKGPQDSEFTRLVSEPILGVKYTDRVFLPGTYTYQIIAVDADGLESAPVTTTVNVRSDFEETEEPHDPREPEEPNPSQDPDEPEEPEHEEEGRHRGH